MREVIAREVGLKLREISYYQEGKSDTTNEAGFSKGEVDFTKPETQNKGTFKGYKE
ncbi:hypothetical protein J2S05_003013 [Alkalicoccobacillus murimartini]|uniref:Uncharacterized protein n=1 Tax=Alkalicoccobacillus murimartini TaxID=171685 RepID=A0ABT9YK11_9BACI|nr:hypothetical protein [Alkalicoccobacillus murimartini]